ncbi:MAG: hypothetical protein D3X82_01250 [Candidatus Leucobacter sulfamidivorax]|nr:hypothetical protein [Candidatus Leucobacter sulfamidivorax]
MTESTLVALFAALGVVGAAAVTAVGVILGLLWRRIAHLEADGRAVWWWARIIADMYYRHRRDGAPDLPKPPNSAKDTSS